MTDFVGCFGQWGLVAGAAEGIGAAYCNEMARIGLYVILVDVNSQRMNLLAESLESKYQVKTHCLELDLAEPGAPGKCMEVIRERGCRLLIYNAAYSRVKPFLAAEPDELDLYININARTPLHLVHLFTRELQENKTGGGVLLMSSLAGLWGTSLVATYSGTKGFNLALAEALSHELKPYGIAVSACCAGATATPGYLGTNPKYGIIRPNVMNPGKVASIALRNLGKKAIIIPGFSNKVTYFILTRILPRRISAWLVNRTMKINYRDIIK
jgi:hypothetical protein